MRLALAKIIGVIVAFCVVVQPLVASAQDIDLMRTDQINRLQDYVLEAIQPSGMVRGALVLNPAGSSFHPATPDTAGFALISLAAFDQVGTLADADQRVVDILKAYTGNTPGVNPERSPDGHYIHYMDLNTGADHPGWDDSYSPIGSALIVAGAQFAANHFAGTSSPLASQISSLADELTDSIDFNAAIHPSLDGSIYLDMTASGGGAGGVTHPWNEYQLVESLALRQEDNDRAVAVKHLWLNTDNIAQRSVGGVPVLVSIQNKFAPAFWVQQAQFFNGDFRHDPSFQVFFENQRIADQAYSAQTLGETYRYGITAGVSPQGYHADKILDHPNNVFSPAAVAAWGDLDTLLDFYNDQIPTSDPRYRYGMVRVSAAQPNWIPSDTGLVDHLFLLYGLIESLEPSFFADRVFAPLIDGDYNFDGIVDAADYTIWRDATGSSSDLRADGDLDGDVDTDDYWVWQSHFGLTDGRLPALSTSVPEPRSLGLVILVLCASLFSKPRIRGDFANPS